MRAFYALIGYTEEYAGGEDPGRVNLKVDCMTETEVKLSQLQQEIAHLTHVSDEGWILQWGENSGTPFEIVCRKANVLQVANLEALLNDGYRKAVYQLK